MIETLESIAEPLYLDYKLTPTGWDFTLFTLTPLIYT